MLEEPCKKHPMLSKNYNWKNQLELGSLKVKKSSDILLIKSNPESKWNEQLLFELDHFSKNSL